MPSLNELAAQVFDPLADPPAWSIADLALQSDRARSDAAIQQALLARRFRTRTVPDIVNRRASRGGFYSGQTTKELGFAGEDVGNEWGRIVYELNNQLADLTRNKFNIIIGRRL